MLYLKTNIITALSSGGDKMHYLITKEELENLAEGKIKVEKLIIPEKRALIVWCGGDVKDYIERNQLTVNLSKVIEIVESILEEYECEHCVMDAIVSAIDEGEA